MTDLADLRAWFSDTETATAAARREAETARDYVDGKQYTAAELADLAERGQPPIVDNRIRPKVNYLLGMEKRGRTDPKAWPRTPADEQAANAATDAIRFVCDDNLFEDSASAVLENMLVEGFGGVDVTVERIDGQDTPRIKIEHFPWDRLFADPHSGRADFSDAKFVGGVLWMDEDAVRERWPESDDAIAGSYEMAGSAGDTYDDKPSEMWADPKRKRVQVIQLHWTEGADWWVATFTGGGFLDKPARSPYVDERGRSECSLILQSGYVDRERRRYGIVRDMIGPQDEVNKRRSKALHLLSVRQVVAEQGAVTDVDAARQQLSRPDGYVEITPGMKFEVQENGDLTQGQFALLQEAKQSLEGIGPNAYLQGKQSQAASGRAIMASQQGGAIEADGAIMDRFHQFKRRVYRVVWNRVKQFWTAETWVRVTDDERNVRFVGLNKPVSMGDHMARTMDERAFAAHVQAQGYVPGDPRLAVPAMGPDGRPVLDNDVSRMMVDIVVDEAPDVAALQSEQFMMLTDLAGKLPGLIPPDALIEASSLRNKDKLLEKLKPPAGPDGQPLPPPPPPEVVKAQAQIEADKAKAQAQLQLDQQKMAADQALAAQRLQLDQARMAAEMEMKREQMLFEQRLAQEKAAADLRLAEMEMTARLEMQREESRARAEAQQMRADAAPAAA